MNSKLNVFVLDNESYTYVINHGHGRIKYDDYIGERKQIERGDFVILQNSNEKSVLKRFWSKADDMIEYTSDFSASNHDILLSMICSLMYECIILIRNDPYLNSSSIMKGYNLHKYEINERLITIEKCALFITGLIDKEELVMHINNAKYPCCDYSSAILIINTYPQKKVTSKSIEHILQAVEEMRKALKYRWKRRIVAKVAYSIHNEPETIMYSC